MRSVIIIGPPASGKLTIAKALAKANGYFLFDNHRSIDALGTLTADQQVTPKGLCHAIRVAVLRAAAASGTPIVFTMVYGHRVDEEVMQEYTRILTTDAPPLIVQLHCAREDSRRRCGDESRCGTSKIREPDRIDGLYAKFDLESDYVSPTQEVVHLNTSKLSVEESVRSIMERA
ncbi:MAG: AAA family ATPase [Kiritimatiellae bacterium]|nr:AAA family ATPase [Kiritimatiellia bacterium]